MAEVKTKQTPPAFGSAMREEEFTLDGEVTFLNHGSWGVVPRQVQEAQSNLIAEMDRNPDLLIRFTTRDYWDQAIARIAPFLGSDPANITFVQNTTSGVSNVLRSLRFSDGDAILYNSLTYGAMKNAVRQIQDITPGLGSVIMPHALPIASSDVIVQQYEDTLDANPNIKLALIDHIASFGILFPLQRLINLCKSRGVLVLVDGAHCPGHVRLDLDTLAPDFYIGNLHKWVYTPRGCAVQWVAPQHHAYIKPAVVSFNVDMGHPEAFFKQGTRDDTPYLTCPTVMDFHHWIGGMETQYAYAEELWRVGLPMLTEAWGTEMADLPSDMLPPFMRLVRLPPLKFKVQIEPETVTTLKELYENYKIWCPLISHAGNIYARISANIYVTISDIEALRDAIIDMMVSK